MTRFYDAINFDDVYFFSLSIVRFFFFGIKKKRMVRSSSSSSSSSSSARRVQQNNVSSARSRFSNWIRDIRGNRRVSPATRDVVNRFIPISSSQRFITGLRDARERWDPSASARLNLQSVMETGLTTGAYAGRRSFSIRRGADPAAIALNMMEYRLQNQRDMTPLQRGRRFVMTVNGVDNSGERLSIVRPIDPSNVNQILS